MNYELLYQPVSTLARLQLDPGEQITAEPGALVGMTPNVHMTTGIGSSADKGGGLLGKLAGAASRMLTGESFFQNTYTAQQAPGELLLSHTLPGDMVMLDVPPHGLKVQSTAYVASTLGVNLKAELGGMKTFFGGEGLFLINATATSQTERILLGAFGGIKEMQVEGDLVIDNGHLVAWEGSLTFNLSKASSGWIASFLSGEGMVCHFKGQGRVGILPRNPNDYGTKMGMLLPPRSN